MDELEGLKSIVSGGGFFGIFDSATPGKIKSPNREAVFPEIIPKPTS
jgi:hypothetical protein